MVAALFLYCNVSNRLRVSSVRCAVTPFGFLDLFKRTDVEVSVSSRSWRVIASVTLINRFASS